MNPDPTPAQLDLAPTQEAPQETPPEEVDPLDMIEMLSDDLATALTALKRIARLKPSIQPGGPNNKNFGKRHQQCLEKAQETAVDALLKIKEGEHTHEH